MLLLVDVPLPMPIAANRRATGRVGILVAWWGEWSPRNGTVTNEVAQEERAVGSCWQADMATTIQTSQDWALANFCGCQFGDERRTRRAVRIARRMADHPAGSSPQQMADWAELKGCYRFFHTKSVTFTELTRPHCQQTRAAARGRVLLINDTTTISFSHRRREVQGLPRSRRGMTAGFLLHNALMVVAATGEIVGLAHQELFQRVAAPKGENRRQRSRRPRETDAWGRTIDAIGVPPEGVEYVHVCDREADNLEVFCHLREQRSQWVIRCSHLNRDVHPLHSNGLPRLRSVEQVLTEAPVLGQTTLALRGRQGQPSRTAQLAIRVTEVLIPQPRRRTPYLRQLDFRGLTQTLVELREVAVPRGGTPLRWVLWTSLPVRTLAEALDVARDYEQRWLIEEFHTAVKTGCQLESRQYESAHCLHGLAGMVSVLAVRLLQLRQWARSSPETPAREIVPAEWLKMVELLRQRRVETLRDFIRQLAALGGFLLRKSDGEPGWITIWRGTQILTTSLATKHALERNCG